MKLITCNACGYVHFEVSRDHAECAIRGFNEWYEKQTLGTKTHYLPIKERRVPRNDRDYELGRSRIENYEFCEHCGEHYKNFKDGGEEINVTRPILRRTD